MKYQLNSSNMVEKRCKTFFLGFVRRYGKMRACQKAGTKP